MAEKDPDRSVCAACGAEIREGSAFCYNCGETLEEIHPVPKPEAVEQPPPAKTSGKGKQKRSQRIETSKLPAFAKPEESLPTVQEMPAALTVKAEPSKELRSAADIRRRPKKTVLPPKEIIWEERTDTGKGFVIGGIVLLSLAAILMYFAFYLR